MDRYRQTLRQYDRQIRSKIDRDRHVDNKLDSNIYIYSYTRQIERQKIYNKIDRQKIRYVETGSKIDSQTEKQSDMQLQANR